MNCSICGNEFAPSLTKPSKFCSPNCRLKHHRLNKVADSDPIQPPDITNESNPRASLEYRSKFTPDTQFLPLDHPIQAFRGLAIPKGWNPESYLPIQPRKLYAKRSPQTPSTD